MGGGCPSVRWSVGTYADETLFVPAATLRSATLSSLMAHLRLVRRQRGMLGRRFPDHEAHATARKSAVMSTRPLWLHPTHTHKLPNATGAIEASIISPRELFSRLLARRAMRLPRS